MRPVLVYSCEAWALNASAKQRITSTERRMVRMMCGVSLADRVPTEQLFGRLNIDCPVLSEVETSQLRWFGHVMRRDTADPISLALDLKVEGKRPKGRPMKTWIFEVKSLMKTRRLKKEDTLKRDSWRSAIQGRPPFSVDWDKAEGNYDDDDAAKFRPKKKLLRI